MTLKNEWKLYEFIDKNPFLTALGLCVRMKWSQKKTNRNLEKLIKAGLVKTVIRRVGKTRIKYYRNTPWKELINWDEMNSKPEDYDF